MGRADNRILADGFPLDFFHSPAAEPSLASNAFESANRSAEEFTTP